MKRQNQLRGISAGWMASVAVFAAMAAGCASRPAPESVAPPVQAVSQPVIHLPGGIEVDRTNGEVRVPAATGITVGWLEQVACVAGTRDHESLVTVECKPSDVHAALLLLGLEPGAPGRWRYDQESVQVVPPRGPAIEVRIRYLLRSVEGAAIAHEVHVLEWIRGIDGRSFPASWVFAGSAIAPNPKSLGPGEHYVADYSGSLVGLVTFGDEVIAATAVIPDLIEFETANWEAFSERMPPEGTPATLVLRIVKPLETARP
ncbi:MAG: YdjY domain-containing protein [Phycisphaerae bacterium]|nr:YdjY domain-containing protein [Phycisphaerae bacterium]